MQDHDTNQIFALPGPGSGAGAPLPASPRQPLKALTIEEFAALGDDELVYRRTIVGSDLKRLFPAASAAPDAQNFVVLFGAGGAPRFISDDEGHAWEWLAQTGLSLATRH